MSEFRKFEKIHRLGSSEVAGILEGICTIQEKIDGANTSIWSDNTGAIHLASRNQLIGDRPFNGFREYVMSHSGIQTLLEDYPDYRLYGEWLTKHTIRYRDESYKHWYMFDIWDELHNVFLTAEEVQKLSGEYGIFYPWSVTIHTPSLQELNTLLGKSDLGERGEGIVIKNEDFVNQWGNRCYAKLVCQEFLESNALTFGGNNKFADNYQELYIINKWMTPYRVTKVANKLEMELGEPLEMRHIPRITNTAYYDMITEECWEIAKMNKSIDFKILKGLAMKKAKIYYVELLDKKLEENV